jgi:hypothetical protein
MIGALAPTKNWKPLHITAVADQFGGYAGHVGTAPNEISSREWLYGRHDDLTVIECRRPTPSERAKLCRTTGVLIIAHHCFRISMDV